MSEINVSIIVPAHNEEVEILDCLKSLLSLDYPKDNYEIIIIDDGSTDNTADVINTFVKKHSNIILLSKDNGGKASAQNLGLKHAKGKFILITDADAVVEKKWISKMITDLETHDLVLGAYYAKDTNTLLEKIQNALYLIKFKFGGMKGTPSIGVNNGFRRDVIEKIGKFNESKTSITDDFIKRSEEAGLKIYFNPEIVVFTKCTRNIQGFLKQKLRWREDSLDYLKSKRITFPDFLSLGYTVGLSFILFISFLMSIGLLNFLYFEITFSGIYLFTLIFYIKSFIKLCKSKKYNTYSIYFLLYIMFEMLIRLILIPYLIYRLIHPRNKPVFEANR